MRLVCYQYLFILMLVGGFSTKLLAQDADEPPEFLPGLLANYEDLSGNQFSRLDLDVQFTWSSARPDQRLKAETPFHVRWNGFLFVNSSGKYRLSVHAVGKFRIHLRDQAVLSGEAQESKWFATEELELPFGRHPLLIEYDSMQSQGRIGLYWSGPQFQMEPIPERHLVHRFEDTIDETFAKGQQLARALRCVACHDGAIGEKPLPGPALTHLRGNLNPSWLVKTLGAVDEATSNNPAVDGLPRRMPHFGIQKEEAQAITAALFHHSAESPLATPYKPAPLTQPQKALAAADAKKKSNAPVRTEPSSRDGKLLFESRGCVACHSTIGDAGLFDGGDLSRISEKRTPDFYARWLEDPRAINAQHRMPQFDLSPLERADLSLYFRANEPQSETDLRSEALPDLVERGERLLVAHRCANCHLLPGDLSLTLLAKKSTINPASDWNHGCLTAPNRERRLPGFGLTTRQRESLKRFWTERNLLEPVQRDGDLLLVERNCVACHARGVTPGIAPKLAGVTEATPVLRTRIPAMTPPSLNGVGDKLHDQALLAAIQRTNSPRRPWLDVRMPKYRFEEQEPEVLVAHLIDHDRIPQSDSVPTEFKDDSAARFAAQRLVTADGFGCSSCHKIGEVESGEVALNARGTDLTMLGHHIRREWFDRWVRNPARIIPRMEMPAIQQPVHGILQNDLALQLAAVWKTLNTPGFNPPPANPVRIVRARNDARSPQPAQVMTDVLEVGKQTYLRPLLVGLTNRHNLLFDLERGQIAGWWIGDAARQRTRGKTWFWEAGNDPLAEDWPFLERWAILDEAGEVWKPETKGQFVITLDTIKHHGTAVEWSGRMQFTQRQSERMLRLTHTVSPLRDMKLRMDGVHIKTSVDGLKKGESLLLETGDPDQRVKWPTDGMVSNRFSRRLGNLSRINFFHSDSSQISEYDRNTLRIASIQQDSSSLAWTQTLTTAISADEFPDVAKPLPKPESIPLAVVPGYDTVQLPLSPVEMPTGIAWQADGTLLVSSLKGRVCQVLDSNRDGLADTWRPISDDFQAPYGLAVHGKDIDVVAKSGLLRLSQPSEAKDFDVPYATQVIADGWGFTADYHDWAVGLPKDKSGNYFVALPCQQDDRTAAAAHLRGQVIKLIPTTPTDASPRCYRIEPHSAGHRFPMGIAMSRDGDLFTSDNQGNYNPFNELNHLVAGARYGFINKLEVAPDFSPPFNAPAIDIPHPWVRSVNGICFLETPPGLRSEGVTNTFGPYEGHLLGCEYNGLSLVRMSLQRIGNAFQGAVYPFSRPPHEGEPTFEGPVVCAVSPRGEIYVGNMRDSGWGGGNNTGSLVRLRPHGALPLGIAEVQAVPEGLTIDFTAQVDEGSATNRESYQLRSYRRISTPAYGGSDVDERSERIQHIELSNQNKRVTLRLNGLREGFVYEVRVAFPGQPDLFPGEAHYTMRQVPRSVVTNE